MGTIADHSGPDPLAVLLESLVASRPDGLEQGLVALDLAKGRPWLQPEAWNAAIQTAPEPRRLGESPDRQDRSVVPRLVGQAPPPTAAQGEATVPLGPAVNTAALAAAPGSPWRALDPIPGNSSTLPCRLWLYDHTGTGVTSTAALPALETVVVTHGWQGSAIANSSKVQMLLFDWGPASIDYKPSGVAPYGAACRVKSVASWAKNSCKP